MKQRCAEFGDGGFAPYVVELACYDLRADAHHTITLEIARDTQSAQDAVDRELVARYRPGQPRAGLLVQVVERIHHLQDIAARSRHELPLPPMSAVAERVLFQGTFGRSRMNAGRRSAIVLFPPTSPG